MGVPAHDECDWNFTKVNRIVDEKDIKRVIFHENGIILLI